MRTFTVDQYHQLIRAGILTAADKVELLDGALVLRETRSPPHSTTTHLAEQAIRGRIGDEWRCRIRGAITTTDSEPEPDISVVIAPPQRYLSNHPVPDDIALIVEVADSAILLEERRKRCCVYGRARIREYWI